MSRLVLVRHGQTMWHADSRYAGRSDIGLTAKGFAQAEQLAYWAARAQLSAVWSSPLSRARNTAAPSAQAAQLPLQIDPRLQELSFGEGEGLTAAEMHARFPAERAAFERDPIQHFLPGGEEPATAADRGCDALRAIASAQPTQAQSLVVGHSTLFRLVLCRLLGLPLAHYRNVFPLFQNGSLTKLEFHSTHVSLLALNVPLPTLNSPEED